MARGLEGVKPGDTIKVNEDYGRGFTLHTVERVTATRAACERASFMIDSGAQVGTRTTGRWSTAKYGDLVKSEDLPALQALIETKRRIVIAQAKISRITIDANNLAAAEALVEASKPKEGECSTPST
jgi:hypothetical protein